MTAFIPPVKGKSVSERVMKTELLWKHADLKQWWWTLDEVSVLPLMEYKGHKGTDYMLLMMFKQVTAKVTIVGC
jgi:hypothetical protein